MSPGNPQHIPLFEARALISAAEVPDAGGPRPTCPLCDGPGKALHQSVTDRLHGTPGQWCLTACTASDCGLVWIDPMPAPCTLAIAYERYFTHTVAPAASRLRTWYESARRAYLARRFGYRTDKSTAWHALLGAAIASLPHRRAAFDASVMWLDAVPGGKVLDIGCGNGTLLAHLAQLGWEGHGLETDPAAAAIARSRGLDVATCPLEASSLPPESFDAIVLSHVIEHVETPRTLLEHCLRHLKPGGRLVLLTPNTQSFGHHRFGRNWLHLDSPRHLHLFSAISLRRLAEAAGFTVEDASTVLRDADWTLGGSQSIRESGHYTLGRLPVRIRVVGLYLMLLEWVRMRFDSNAGEEVLLIARRPG